MTKEISYFEQALELPNFSQALLVSLIMASSEDVLECIALRYMETLPECDEYIPAQIEVGA
tara:strand:+ start:520 stop:702 length:183 start_codon:yes stop_codon:yes gene_type:complete